MITTAQPAVAWSAHILDRTGTLVPELADERVRMAMSYALDRDAYWDVREFRLEDNATCSTWWLCF